MINWTILEDVAEVALGYKSLQNDFFYLNRETVASFGIEPEFLMPIYMLRDFHSDKYFQSGTSGTYLFYCDKKRTDLRGRKALSYIRTMGDKAASQKKQSGKIQTVRDALTAQGGSVWYAPKAKPHRANIWLRKAFNAVYSPFIFETPVLVDQRCNRIVPREGIEWRLLAAMLTSSLFSYALEVNGTSSLGAGALELPTKKLRAIPVPDPRDLTDAQQHRLIKFATAVWQTSTPIDWAQNPNPSKELKALDKWLIARLNTDVSCRQIYKDLGDVSRARVQVARERSKSKKAAAEKDVSGLAEAICAKIRPLLEAESFPDGQLDGNQPATVFSLEGHETLHINFDPFLSNVDIRITDKSGDVVLEGTHPKPIAELIVRALLIGRREFSVPTDERFAETLNQSFNNWFAGIELAIEKQIMQSAMGTAFEDDVRAKVLSRLRIDSNAGEKIIPRSISISNKDASAK